MSIGATSDERFDSITTSPSADNRTSASRTGERNSANRSDRPVSSSAVPGRNSSVRISRLSAS